MKLTQNNITIDIPTLEEEEVDQGTRAFLNIMLKIIDKGSHNIPAQLHYLSFLHTGKSFAEVALNSTPQLGAEFISLLQSLSNELLQSNFVGTTIEDFLNQVPNRGGNLNDL